MTEKKPTANSTTEERRESRSNDHGGVVDILMEISSKNDPPAPELVARSRRVRYCRSAAARIEQSEDNKDEEGSSSSNSSDDEEMEEQHAARAAGASMVPSSSSTRTRSQCQAAAARDKNQKTVKQQKTSKSSTKKPMTPARQRLMAKRRQVCLFRMQERRRVQNFREKAVMIMARNMLPADKLKEMEEKVAENALKRQKEQELHRHRRQATMETLASIAESILEQGKK